MQALEIGHFRRITGFCQRFVASLDKLDHAAAQHGLLAEQVGFALIAESCFDNAGAPAAQTASIGHGNVTGLAAGVLMHRHQTRHTATSGKFTAHGMAGALRGRHRHIQIGARHNQIEVNGQAMGKHQHRAFAQI